MNLWTWELTVVFPQFSQKYSLVCVCVFCCFLFRSISFAPVACFIFLCCDSPHNDKSNFVTYTKIMHAHNRKIENVTLTNTQKMSSQFSLHLIFVQSFICITHTKISCLLFFLSIFFCVRVCMSFTFFTFTWSRILLFCFFFCSDEYIWNERQKKKIWFRF